MTVGQRIIALRKEKGLTRIALAEKLGIPQTTLRNYENGLREPGHFFLIDVAKQFNVSIDFLLGLSAEKNQPISGFKITPAEQEHIKKYRDLDDHGKDMVDTVLDKEYTRMMTYEVEKEAEEEYYIKYCDMPASAGTGVNLSDESYQKLKVPKTPTTLRANFAIRVSGNSMEPEYYDGDILLIEEMPDIEVGEIGIFILNGAGYVKQKGENGLISLNETYNDIEINGFDTCKCVGKVIGKL